jgi:beta-lactamase class A
MLNRRGFVGAALAAGVSGKAGALTLPPPWMPLIELEQKFGGRLGFAMASAAGPTVDWRGGERFAFCSSFKMSLAALVLDGAARGAWSLDEEPPFSTADILPNSPVVKAHLAQGRLSMGALAEAAQKTSDNAAANLLLRRIGGLDRLNAFWRGLGDRSSRIDDYETELNRVPLGNPRNTTSPRAAAEAMVQMFARGGVKPQTAATLKSWMHDTATGAKRLRAGLPADWWAGDKTGTGLPDDIAGTYVDLAWVEPPNHSPFAIAAFYQPPKPTPDGDPNAEAILAEVGRIVAQAVMAQAAMKPQTAKP